MSEQNLNGRLAQLVDDLVQSGLSLSQARSEFEKQFIVACLRSHEGSIGRCAKALGIHRNTLRNKLSTLGIDAKDAAVSS